MAHIKRKYIDSHWLVFIFQGLIALAFGCFTLFTSYKSSTMLIPLAGISLLALAIVEFANSVYRSYNRHGWLVSTLVAVFDAAFGILLFFAIDKGMTWHLVLMAIYTLLRGIFELIIAFRTPDDATDRFIWALCGVCGVVFGIAIFNSGHLAGVDFMRFFGAYMLILGVSCLIYSAHNRADQRADHLARSESAKRSPKTPSQAAKTRKTTKK